MTFFHLEIKSPSDFLISHGHISPELYTVGVPHVANIRDEKY